MCSTILDPWLAKRVQAGWSVDAIVTASGGRVSRRTVYRWRAELVSVEPVRVGACVATFAIRRRGSPIRLTEWESAA